MTWSAMVKALAAGESDATATDFSISLERTEVIDMSIALDKTDYVYVKLACLKKEFFDK